MPPPDVGAVPSDGGGDALAVALADRMVGAEQRSTGRVKSGRTKEFQTLEPVTRETIAAFLKRGDPLLNN